MAKTAATDNMTASIVNVEENFIDPMTADEVRRWNLYNEAKRCYRHIKAIEARYNVYPARASDLLGIPGATDQITRGDLTALGIWWARLRRTVEEGNADMKHVLQVLSEDEEV